LKAYCIYCKTGSESAIANRVNEIFDNTVAYAPVRVLQEKRKGSWEECEQILIPGYVFIYFEEETDLSPIKELTGVYKILQYQSGSRELVGSDLEYALWVYSHKGRIGPSKALVEGSMVKIVDGPLIDGVGKIIRLDRHKRRAWVEFDFDGKIQRVSLSVVDVNVL
jgi:transcription antitermination factor NusG